MGATIQPALLPVLRRMFVNRLEDAVLAGRLRLSAADHVNVLLALFPEDYADPPVPPEPTRTLPGTETRIRALAARAARGVALYHPQDGDWSTLTACGQARRVGRVEPEGDGRSNGRSATATVVRETSQGTEDVEENEEMAKGTHEWRVTLPPPDGRSVVVRADSRSLARSLAKKALGLRRRTQALKGTRIERVD